METIVKVSRKDSLGRSIKELSLIEQMTISELVERFLAAGFDKQQEVLTKLRK